MSKFSLILGATLALTLVPVGVAAGTPEKAKSQGEQKICKRQDASTGSRMGARKVCKTKAEWDRQEAAGREMMEDITRRSGIQKDPNAGG